MLPEAGALIQSGEKRSEIGRAEWAPLPDDSLWTPFANSHHRNHCCKGIAVGPTLSQQAIAFHVDAAGWCRKRGSAGYCPGECDSRRCSPCHWCGGGLCGTVRLTCDPARHAGAAADTVPVTGALLGGAAHWTSTTKALREEGIDPRARIRALPLAVRHFPNCCRGKKWTLAQLLATFTTIRPLCRQRRWLSAQSAAQSWALRCTMQQARAGWSIQAPPTCPHTMRLS